MDDRAWRRPAASTLIALVELVEKVGHDSPAGLPLDLTLEELRGVLVDCEARSSLSTTEGMDPFARMREVVDHPRREVSGGRVQSISGLATEGRRLAHELDALTPAAA